MHSSETNFLISMPQLGIWDNFENKRLIAVWNAQKAAPSKIMPR